MIPQQGTREWVTWRKDKIGASDAPIILNLSPWKIPNRLWLEKQGLREEEPLRECMRRGIALEEEARHAFEKSVGFSFFPTVVVHPDHPWMIASLDGMTLDGDRIVEIKVPGKRTLEAAARGEIEQHYLCQVQHQLAVTGLSFAYFWVWDCEAQSGVCIIVDRDEEMIAKIIEEETKFWECLRTATPPSSRVDDYVVIDSPEWNEAAEEWKIAMENIKKSKQYEKETRARLINLTSEPKARGNGIRMTKVSRQGGVDIESICKRFSITKDALEEFRKESLEFYKIIEE